MANEYAVNQADLKAVADAIRTKGGTSGALTFPDKFVSAISAIQAGSGGGNGLAYDMGEFSVDTDKTQIESIPHNLGEKPDVCIIWTDYFRDKNINVDNKYTEYTTTTNIGLMFFEGIAGIDEQRLTSTNSLSPSVKINMTISSDDYRVNATNPNSNSYAPYVMTETEIKSLYIGNTYWRAAFTYKYFVCKKWW